MSTTALSTTQIRLPEQAAAPDGPLDLTMMFVVHRAFRRDLRNFSIATDRSPVSDRTAWAALDARWQLFAAALHHHHSVEDARMWPLLRERADAAGEAGAPALLDAMAAEHEQIDPLLEAVRAGFAAVARDAHEDARAALAVRTAAAREQLLRHLAHEESAALALAQRVLTSQQWTEVMAAFNEGLGLRDLAFLAPWALHELPNTVARTLFTGKDRPVAWLNVLLLRRLFLRRENVAFRYV